MILYGYTVLDWFLPLSSLLLDYFEISHHAVSNKVQVETEQSIACGWILEQVGTPVTSSVAS
jgi:hypothetical protein